MRAAQNAHQTPNRILLLEDDRELGRFIATGLQHNGFDVMHIRDGRKGLAHSKKRAYDVILLDVMMPGMNGFDVLKALRSDNFKGGIIMLTCQGQESDRIDGLNRGADDYIVKPFLAKQKRVLPGTSANTLLRRKTKISLLPMTP